MVEKESEKVSLFFGKKTSRRNRKIAPQKRKRSLQNSASFRKHSSTVIDIPSDSINRMSPKTDHDQVDETSIKRPSKELIHLQEPDDNTDIPDASDYQAPFEENDGKRSEFALLSELQKQRRQTQYDMQQEQRDERRKELQELRDEIRQQLEMRDERMQELHNEIREEIKILINAVKPVTDDTNENEKESATIAKYNK